MQKYIYVTFPLDTIACMRDIRGVYHVQKQPTDYVFTITTKHCSMCGTFVWADKDDNTCMMY